MKESKIYGPYKFPQWAVCPLVNDDKTGITDKEEEILSNWIKTFDRFKDDNSYLYFDIGEEIGFCRNPEFGLACDCVEVTVHIFKA